MLANSSTVARFVALLSLLAVVAGGVAPAQDFGPPAPIGRDAGNHIRSTDQIQRAIDLLMCLGIQCGSPELIAAASDLEDKKDSGEIRAMPLGGAGAVTMPDSTDNPTEPFAQDPPATSCYSNGSGGCNDGGDQNQIVLDDSMWAGERTGDSPLQWGPGTSGVGDAQLASLLAHEHAHVVGNTDTYVGGVPTDQLKLNFSEHIGYGIQIDVICKIIELPFGNICITLNVDEKTALYNFKDFLMGKLDSDYPLTF